MAEIKYKLRKDDLVEVIAGKDKGKKGKIIKIDSSKGRGIIAGVNMVKKAMKKRKQNDRGGIMEIEAALAISNVMMVCQKCGPVRLGYKIADGKKSRVCRSCGGAL